jgi:hypothetical protein
MLSEVCSTRNVTDKNVWGEVSMCNTPPTLIIVHVDLVQHFIEDTVLQLTTGNVYNWSNIKLLVLYNWLDIKLLLEYNCCTMAAASMVNWLKVIKAVTQGSWTGPLPTGYRTSIHHPTYWWPWRDLNNY